MDQIKRFSTKVPLSSCRILAIVLGVFLIFFSLFVFLRESAVTSNLSAAEIVEILELEDDQGIIYQNYLVKLKSSQTQLQIQVPLNLPEVRGLDRGNKIYLQKLTESEEDADYAFASVDKTTEFSIILGMFAVLVIVILGTKPLKSLFPAFGFSVLIAAGVFNMSLEMRFVFLSILGFTSIITLISVLWYFEDILLGAIISLVTMLTLLFSGVLYTLLANFAGTEEIIHFQDLLSKQSMVYEFAQAKLVVIMIVCFGLLISLIMKVIASAKEYTKTRKNIGRFYLIKHTVETVQTSVGEMLNTIFFLALGLNFTGLLSENFSLYKYIWNNSFFLGIMVDGIVISVALLIGGYISGLVVSLYYEHKDNLKLAYPR